MNSSILFPCPKCSTPVCQRAFTMNLAFGNDEEQYCLQCLSKIYDQNLDDFFETGLHYVMSRDCFKEAWNKLKDKSECPCPDKCAFNRCFQ
ncbi:MAG: hypothetical protein QNJ31_00070 [Candidatus Caenarcaniphilales bacterium]|nr:hypothetical protein [Candidatus Caenarcaniphilales bacterium]